MLSFELMHLHSTLEPDHQMFELKLLHVYPVSHLLRRSFPLLVLIMRNENRNSFRAVSRIRKQLLFSYTAWTKTKRNLKSKQTSNGYLRKRYLLSHLDCNDRKKWNSVSLAKRSSFNIWHSPSTVYLKTQFDHTQPLSCTGWRNFTFHLSFDMVIF